MSLFALTAPGLAAVAETEARQAEALADLSGARAVPGGVELFGRPLSANRALAIPTRILQRVADFPARTFAALIAGAVDWSLWPGGLTPKVSCRKSRLYHSGAVAARLQALLPPGPTILHARLDHDRCTLSVDTSGARLHQRGWRQEGGPAPLRETLAAGILALAGWSPPEALYDPMCGSGTFLIEAASRAAGLAPGRLRSFACEAWCPHEPPPTGPAIATSIAGSDRSAGAVACALRNAERAGVRFPCHRAPAERAEPPAERGLLIANPPYDRRLERARPAFQALGAALRGPFAAWRAALLCPRGAGPLVAALGRPVQSRTPLRNGGWPVELLQL